MKRIALGSSMALLSLVPALAAAQSSVTLYGIVDATVQTRNNRAGSDGAVKVGDGAYTGSRLGFRGQEDLGGGMAALFMLENGFDPASGAVQQATARANNGQAAAPEGRFFGREAWVGLQSYLGRVTMGRQYTIAHPLSGKFQPQANPNLDAISVFSGHHVARQDNMVRYAGQFGAVGVHASYTFSDGNGKGSGIGLTYTAGPVDLVAYHQRIDNAARTVMRRITGLGGNYALTKDTKLFLGAMQRDDRGGPQKNAVYNLGFNHALTPTLLLTANITQDRQSGVAAGKRTVVFLGADAILSRRTDVYALVAFNRLSGAYPLPSFMGEREASDGLTVGIRHRF